ncbi:V-type ATP synthase subunit I [Halobacteriales archaeon QH_10_67_13]|nr:MAG: V-type ATP synthase subunit I [Halobacteriales archaeon QH_10_67_13]
MLRPERMSKVSVTGSTAVMSDVIEVMYELGLLDITEYDGSWEGFEPGDSLEGADEISSRLVTVRALQSTLRIADERPSEGRTVDPETATDRLETLNAEVNEFDDRRDELRDRRREIDETIDRLELLADLGLDLDLLWGYDELSVRVGEGDREEIRAAVAAEIDEFDVLAGEETGLVAVFARTDAETLNDALVGVRFAELEVPERSDDPENALSELRQERQEITAELERTENELDALRADAKPFLLGLEQALTAEAEKLEAPLAFATTDRSFIVEGWVPTGQYDELDERLTAAVDDRVDVAELKQAAYTSRGSSHEVEPDPGRGAGGGSGESGRPVASDGGVARSEAGDGVETVDDDPPVLQSNSGLTSPFEVLTNAVNRPKYSEFDPTLTLVLTFPLFFGFMIGDVGYGLIYVGIGYWVYSSFDSKAISEFGTVVAWLGVFAVGFGFLYGEVFGLHFLEWYDIHPVIEKGLTAEEWARAWIVVTVMAGWLHLGVGYLFDFIEEFQLVGAKEALLESGSWLLMLNGIWVWIFSEHVQGPKPEFIFEVFAGEPFPLGFTGFPELVGIVGLVAYFVGLGLLVAGPTYEVAEFAVPLVHTLSYTRLAAVLISKAGMALAANLLYFGAYQDAEGEYHYLFDTAPETIGGSDELIFSGLSNVGSGIEGAIIGLPVLLIGHAIVLAIGGTAGLQAVRLEYVEFFEKFYEGGGRSYEPFGRAQ